MNISMVTLEHLEELIRCAKEHGFPKDSEVFMNLDGELAITHKTIDKGYEGWFLNFETWKIYYSN
jgi:hypothetical protein